MKKNIAIKIERIHTAEGGRATPTDAFHNLKRSVMACMLWEDIHYEDGAGVAERIVSLVPQVEPEQVAVLACEARDRMQLRHAPLLLVRELARSKGNGALVAATLEHIIQRADELGEFLNLYWTPKKTPIAAGVKRGLANAFGKFNEYALGKYNRDSKVKLKDILFLAHPKPKDEEQAALWKRLIDGTLATPLTWETELSAGKNKRETFERLMRAEKLGGLATLRNLRNMIEARVDEGLIRERLSKGCGRALPFRFIAAAKYAPRLEDAIGDAMIKSVAQVEKLPGRTLLVIDTSGSMHNSLSSKSEMSRLDAAAGLAILAREVCETPVIYATAGNDAFRKHATMELPARRGFALADAIKSCHGKIGGGGIFMVQCLNFIARREPEPFDRVIVFTDEQDCDLKGSPANAKKLGRFNYVVNVSVEKNGISYRTGWDHIDGFSEACLDYIREYETFETETKSLQ